MNWKKVVGVPLLALGVTIAPVANAGDLSVTNGSFETYSGGYGATDNQLGAVSQLGSGTDYTQVSGWTLGQSTYGFLMNANSLTNGSYSPQFHNEFYLWGPSANAGGVANGLTTSPDGGNFLALDGASDYHGAGISQQITGLTVGNLYSVTFDWAAAQQHGFDGATTESLSVSLGSSTQSTSTFNLDSHAFSGWMTETFTFQATSASEALTFLANGTPDSQPPFVLLDGVNFSAVPEPSAAVLLGLGIVVLGAASLRQRVYTRRKMSVPAIA
jgi:hypothetical protein